MCAVSRPPLPQTQSDPTSDVDTSSAKETNTWQVRNPKTNPASYRALLATNSDPHCPLVLLLRSHFDLLSSTIADSVAWLPLLVEFNGSQGKKRIGEGNDWIACIRKSN
ncbi:hypothetical protein AKJ16_DCAP01482 [Drosera capensis]